MARPESPTTPVERVQTGVRIEKRILKVLRALAEHKEVSLGDLLEGIVLHAFDGKPAFSPDTLEVVEKLRAVYGLDLRADAAHRLRDQAPDGSDGRAGRPKRRARG